MLRDDDQLERYLSEFQPCAVRPLEVARPAAQPRLKWLAIAAMALVCAGGGFWYWRHARTVETTLGERPVRNDVRVATGRLSTFSLTKLGLENKSEFEAQLDAESRQVLPSFQGEQSTLHTLAKE